MVLKNAIFLAIACLIIGFVWFAVCFWLLGWDFKAAMSDARLVATTCFIVELLRPWLQKKFGRKAQQQ
jgi:hypothetical protein